MGDEDAEYVFRMEMDPGLREVGETFRRERDNPPEVDPQDMPMVSRLFIRDEAIPLGPRMLVSSSHELQWVGPRGE